MTHTFTRRSIVAAAAAAACVAAPMAFGQAWPAEYDHRRAVLARRRH
jgi:hypothetical protein